MRWTWYWVWAASVAVFAVLYDHLDVKRMLGIALVLLLFVVVKSLEATNVSK